MATTSQKTPNISQKMYSVKCKGGVVVKVPEKIIRQSQLLHNMIGKFFFRFYIKLLPFLVLSDDKDSVLNVSQVDSKVLKSIITFLEPYQNEKPYKPAKDYRVQISPRDDQFLANYNGNQLVELLNTANYLSVYRLIDAGCLRIRGMIENRTAEEIRHILQLPDDLTDEEKREIERVYVDPEQPSTSSTFFP